MKQHKRGFTLIELLAVIVILAIIALIAVPVIMNIISSARKSAFEDTAYGIIKAGELYYANALLNDGMTTDREFTFTEGAVSPEGLSIQGSLPQSGKLVVARDGKTAIAISNGTYCITKGYDEIKITTTDEFEKCDVPTGIQPGTLASLAKTNDFATTVHACTTSGVCEPGTKFAIEVAPGNIQNFYVVSDANNTVTLIMDRNIGEEVAWITEEDYLLAGGILDEWNVIGQADPGSNNKGPLTALNYLESQTLSWTNIPAKTYILKDDNNPKQYNDIERTNTRARMLTKTEASNLECTGAEEYDKSCPAWLYENLSAGSEYYWLSTTDVNPDGCRTIYYEGFVDYVSVTMNLGVRPVIEISK